MAGLFHLMHNTTAPIRRKDETFSALSQDETYRPRIKIHSQIKGGVRDCGEMLIIELYITFRSKTESKHMTWATEMV